jgi:HlyD family secretion protein
MKLQVWARHAWSVMLRTAETLWTRAAPWVRRHPRGSLSLLAGLVVIPVAGAFVLSHVDPPYTVRVHRGTLRLTLTETGVLRPAESVTYRSPLTGRELEITFLVPEGTRVGEGDLIIRLDTADLEKEYQRAVQDVRQAQMDVRSAVVDREEAKAALDSLEGGAASLGLDEARAQLRVAEMKVERLRSEYKGLKPLMEKGFITRDELERSSFELEQAEAELQLARKKADIYVKRTYPQDRERARLLLDQKTAQEANAQQRVVETTSRAHELEAAIDGCSVYAERPGLVVYEELLSANPRRKIRVGDRVTRSQGIITIPEVSRMVVEASVDEASVHKVHPGLPATIRLDAYPDLLLTGKVARVGTMAQSSADRPFEDKRFDLVVDVDSSKADLRPEMTARVDVLLGELKDRLWLPVNAVFEEDGILVAHVRGLWRNDVRRVQIGESNDSQVEIVAGLREGERVSLLELPGASRTDGQGPPGTRGPQGLAGAGGAVPFSR